MARGAILQAAGEGFAELLINPRKTDHMAHILRLWGLTNILNEA